MKEQMASQSQDSLRLQSKAIRQNSRSSNSSAAKIYFRTIRTCNFFGDFSRSKMSLPQGNNCNISLMHINMDKMYANIVTYNL